MPQLRVSHTVANNPPGAVIYAPRAVNYTHRKHL